MVWVSITECMNGLTDIKYPKTKIAPDYIAKVLHASEAEIQPTAKVLFIGNRPSIDYIVMDEDLELAILTFHENTKTYSIKIDKEQGDWLLAILDIVSPAQREVISFKQLKRIISFCRIKKLWCILAETGRWVCWGKMVCYWSNPIQLFLSLYNTASWMIFILWKKLSNRPSWPWKLVKCR